MNVKTYGIPMVNLEEAVESINSWPMNCGYTQVHYDKSSGRIIVHNHVDTESYVVYDDPDVVGVLNTQRRVTAQRLADAIREAVEYEGDEYNAH